MGIYKVINAAGDYRNPDAVDTVVSYVVQPSKAEDDGIFGGAVTPEIAAISMKGVIEAYHHETGPYLRHSVLCFSPEEGLEPADVKQIAQKAIRYYEDRFQILAVVHEDKPHLHVHLVMNTTSYVDGKKYHGDKKDYYGFLEYLNVITKPYHASVHIAK